MIDSKILSIQFLDWLYDFRAAQPGEMAAMADYLGDEELDDHAMTVWRGILEELEQSGLILLASSLAGVSGTSALLTGVGRAQVEETRRRRQDRARRSVAARDAVVRWIYANPGLPDLKSMLVDVAGFYEGQPFELADLDAALEYLHRKELIDGVDVAEFILVSPRLTDKGIDCADRYGGSVCAYLQRRPGGGGMTNTVNFNAPVSGPVAWGNREVAQTVTSNGVAGDELMILIRALIQASPILGLSKDESDKVTRDAQVIEGELDSPQPDSSVVRTFMKRVLDRVGSATSDALALVLTAYAKDLMKRVGILID